MQAWVPWCSAVLVALTNVAAPAAAQRVVDLQPVGVVQHRLSAGPWRPTQRVAAASEHHTLWPWFALGGAVLGAGTVVVMASTHCDAGCRDDGGWGYVPAYAAVGAGIGALAGGVLGVLVDMSRREQSARLNDRR